MDAGPYCREVESYLCRKNDGHLIRIVGPAFELVCTWAEREIPLRVVHGAIDRTFHRYYAKGPRRRPVRIEFCEADVLDLFDEWRRAVGVRAEAGEENQSPRRPSLAAHIERVMDRLSGWLETGDIAESLSRHAGGVMDELARMEDEAHTARGDARGRLVDRLADIDRQFTVALRETIEPGLRETLRVEAVHELEPFRQRMPPRAYEQAVVAGTERLLCDHCKLPRIAFP